MSVGGSIGGTPGDLKSEAQGIIENVIFSGYAVGNDVVKIRASYDNNCADAKTDAFTHLTDATPTLKLINSKFVEVKVYTKSNADDASACPVQAADQTAAEEATTPSDNATGADITVFADWTAASISGSL